MKIALIGQGKMGKLIASLISPVATIEEADVCIDFSVPSAVRGNVERVCAAGKNLVMGTTGWEDHLEEVKRCVQEAGIGMIYSPNFSVGVARFTQLIQAAKELMKGFDVAGWEIHHREKLDAPSGTALRLGVESASIRVGHVPGTHTVIFDSPTDSVEITHRSRSREAFARGALEAAHWVHGKKGFFTMDDML